MLETLNSLPLHDKSIVINYVVSGILFVLFAYVIYACRTIKREIRWPISLLMLGIGFTFLSASGRILQGYSDTMTSITQWGVIFSTILGFWVAVEFIRWNNRNYKNT